MSDEVLVKVEGVSKKFCRSLKRSLWYGVQDVSAEMFGRKGSHDELRKNEFWAVNDVSFELKRGECLGLIGPNGAGKSTLLKMLNGLVKPDKGRITMRGRVGALIELGAGFNPILTARENIYVNGSVLGFSKKELGRKFDEIVDFAEIEEFIDTPVQNYSSGMKVRLGFAVAAQLEPDVLLIDEILAVGDAGFRTKCINSIAQISKTTGVIFVSHSMPLVGRMSDHILLIVGGDQKGVGLPPTEVIHQYMASTKSVSRFERGTDRVVLERVLVNSEPLRPSEYAVVDQFAPFSMLFDFDLINAPADLILNLSFFDAEEKNVLESFSNQSGFVLKPKGNQCSVSVKADSLDLNAGNYGLLVSLIERKPNQQRGEIIFANRGFGGLSVKGSQIGYAPVQQKLDWSLV